MRLLLVRINWCRLNLYLYLPRIICRKAKVPDILLSTIEPPDNLPIIGRGCFVESTLCRQLKDVRGESIAKDISDGLPFLEYELHRLLINKLKIKGMNSIFGLKIKISVGERMLTGIATGTALFLAPLPTPNIPKIVSDRDDKKISDLQKELHETVRKNRDIYQLKGVDEISNGRTSDNEDSEDEPSSLDLSLGNKDCCVLEVGKTLSSNGLVSICIVRRWTIPRTKKSLTYWWKDPHRKGFTW